MAGLNPADSERNLMHVAGWYRNLQTPSGKFIGSFQKLKRSLKFNVRLLTLVTRSPQKIASFSEEFY
jgi:hypothetical protein